MGSLQSLRKEDGVAEGEILIDGRALGGSFQRTTAYVSQMDVHDPHQTVREALVFSALLRQPHDVPEEDKLAYVDTVIDMLDVSRRYSRTSGLRTDSSHFDSSMRSRTL